MISICALLFIGACFLSCRYTKAFKIFWFVCLPFLSRICLERLLNTRNFAYSFTEPVYLISRKSCRKRENHSMDIPLKCIANIVIIGQTNKHFTLKIYKRDSMIIRLKMYVGKWLKDALFSFKNQIILLYCNLICKGRIHVLLSCNKPTLSRWYLLT